MRNMNERFTLTTEGGSEVTIERDTDSLYLAVKGEGEEHYLYTAMERKELEWLHAVLTQMIFEEGGTV